MSDIPRTRKHVDFLASKRLYALIALIGALCIFVLVAASYVNTTFEFATYTSRAVWHVMWICTRAHGRRLHVLCI